MRFTNASHRCFATTHPKPTSRDPTHACRLHYPPPGQGGQPPNASLLWQGLSALAQWRARRQDVLPAMLWMDTPVQHFSTPDGSWPGGQKPYQCSPLKAWFEGEPHVQAGGAFNEPLAPLIPLIADAHLKTWWVGVRVVLGQGGRRADVGRCQLPAALG